MTVPASIATGGHATDAEIVDAQNAINILLGLYTSSVHSVASGGTGIGSYTAGDILYASAVAVLSKLAKGTTTQVLHSGTTPSWSAVDLVNDITSTLAEAHGGTNQTTYAQGDMLYASASNTLSKLAKGTSGQLLQQGASIPAWAGDTAWTAMTGSYTNSWVDFGAPELTGAYFKDASGFVHLRGSIKSGTISTDAFTLPAGYRPSARVRAACDSNSLFGECLVSTSGAIRPNVGTNVHFAMDGITFDTR